MEIEVVLVSFLRCHPGIVVHYDNLFYCYDSDTDEFLYRYEDEDDHAWRVCEELTLSFEVNSLYLNNFDHS